jgi:Domain of unknown function (DUF397)
LAVAQRMQIPGISKRRQRNAQAVWRKSRACATSECVEVATLADGVGVRGSRSPDVVLTFTKAEWRAFLLGAKAGDFDDVAPTG